MVKYVVHHVALVLLYANLENGPNPSYNSSTYKIFQQIFKQKLLHVCIRFITPFVAAQHSPTPNRFHFSSVKLHIKMSLSLDDVRQYIDNKINSGKSTLSIGILCTYMFVSITYTNHHVKWYSWVCMIR